MRPALKGTRWKAYPAAGRAAPRPAPSAAPAPSSGESPPGIIVLVSIMFDMAEEKGKKERNEEKVIKQSYVR